MSGSGTPPAEPRGGHPDSAAGADPGELRLRLLGHFAVSVGGRVVEESAWRLVKARSLVKLLALAPGHRFDREQIMDLLWPDLDPQAAANNLHYALYVARRAVLPAGARQGSAATAVLQLRQGVLSLQPSGPLWIDVEAFEAAVAVVRRTREPRDYHAALDLYTGDLLSDDRYEDWVAGRRDLLRQTFLTLLGEVAGLHEAEGEVAAAIVALERVVAAEPSDEAAHAGLMRLHAQAGRRHQALRQYTQLQAALRRELDAEPATATTRLYEEIVAGRFPAAKAALPPALAPTPAARGHNLPVPLTSLIGRAGALAEVKELLATARLLTLTGTGGCGKTRLAVAVAGDMTQAYGDGVWLVELAALSDAALVPEALAGVVGVRQQGGQALVAALVEALRPTTMLLVLDNCEHLIDACAQLVATLLAGCPGLRVLATSREALQVPGEVTWRVPSLALPDPPGLPTGTDHLAALSRSGAVQLLLDRVRWRHPAFALTEKNAPAIVETCRRLDGIPLAIELAAARTSVLGIDEVATRLDNAIGLLTGSSRTAPPRQQTLQATLDWSYALLTPAEQAVLRQLAVFAGGWTLPAAEAVGRGGILTEDDVLPLLAQLIDKSLVLLENGDGGGDTRYRLLETVQQYAWGHLVAQGDAALARARHAAYFLALAEEAEPRLAGPGQLVWLERLEREHDNLRAALRWAQDSGNGDLGLRMAGSLWRFWAVRGHAAEGRRWLERLLALEEPATCERAAHAEQAAPGGGHRAAARAKALTGAGALAREQSDFAQARLLHQQSLILRRELGDASGIATALNSLGNVAREQGDYPGAAALYEESLALYRELDNQRGLAGALGNLGSTLQEQGHYQQATVLQEESLALYHQLGDKRGSAITLTNLGVLAQAQGDHRRAAALYDQSLMVRRELGDKRGLALTLTNLGSAMSAQGDHERAAASFAESLALFSSVGDRRVAALCLSGMAAVAAARGEFERATRLFGAAAATRAAIGTALPASDHAAHQEEIAAVRAALGDGFPAAWAVGHALSLEQAITEALRMTA